MKQTSVEWLVEQLKIVHHPTEGLSLLDAEKAIKILNK